MDQYLVIRFTQQGIPVSWVPTDRTGRPIGAVLHGELADAAAMANGRRVVAIVPAEMLLLARVTLPEGRRSTRWLQAVPFALEDRLSEDVEALHFVVGEGWDADGRVPVAAVSKSSMSAWLDAARGAGIPLHAMVPDCLALPFEPGQVTVAVDGERTLCRDGACDGFSCETGLFETLLDARARDTGTAAWEVRSLAAEAGVLAALAPGAVSAPLNLLQGEYRPRASRMKLGPWRVPAALAAALLLVSTGHWLAGYILLSQEHGTLRASIEEEFMRALPNEPMVDPRAQFERRLGGRAAESGEWLRMLDALSSGLPRVPGAELQAIVWRPGAMEVSLTTQRAEHLDALRAYIAEAGQETSIESASSRGDRVDGRLRIRSGG